jgi:eukaryotic-like serine/threonine-protein kinase
VNSEESFRIALFGCPSIVAGDGQPVGGRAMQRHRLALLALLSIPAHGGSTRDRLLGYLWPESEADRARALLNQSVYQLRKALGDEAIVSVGDELRLNHDVLRVDVALFEAAIATGDRRGAVDLHRGPLLDGFFLSDAPEFERWLERERARLANAYAQALEALAEEAERCGDGLAAVEWWKARAAHDPFDSRIALRLVHALASVGNRAGGLQHAAAHARLLREEFGMVLPDELQALTRDIRTQLSTASPDIALEEFSGARDLAAARLPPRAASAAGATDPPLPTRAPATARRGRLHASTARGYALTTAAAAVIGALVFGLLPRRDDTRWLLQEALPRIEAYLDVADWESAYTLARKAESRVAGHPLLAELWPRITWRVSLASEPDGARVFRQPYAGPEAAWEELGRTPLVDIRIPYGVSRLRFEHEGRRPLLRALGGAHINWQELIPGDPDFLLVGPETYMLDSPYSLPPDLVRVPGGRVFIAGEALDMADSFIGRYEVTNAEFKQFVDAGGYQRPELWDPIVIGSDTVPWLTAAALWVDRTGRPGPSTWEASDYPRGEGDHPVSGVSWYEAAAFARFAGRELPTAYHWQQALADALFPWLLPASNFGGERSRAVTASTAMSHVAAFDLTGNVREWTATAIGAERVVLGGSWNDPYYIAGTRDASAPPEDRSPGNGIRLALTRDETTIAARLRAPLTARTTGAQAISQPVGDSVYAAYSRVFDYDRDPLRYRLESVDSTRVWIRERISFDAAYGDERMIVHMYLPPHGRPPLQTVVYWPGWDTFVLDDVDEYFAKQVDFIVKSGRAVAFPIYRGSFGRSIGNQRGRPAFGTAEFRDNTIYAVKDLRRTIDYLQTRTDIDPDAIAFFGYSWGGVTGPVALAQEPRLRIGIIKIGLLPPLNATPEVDPVHALPRVRVPTLLFSGEFDPMVPTENSNRYFELLGTAATHKRHVVAIGGHYIPRALLIRETLDWLDSYLGPVVR